MKHKSSMGWVIGTCLLFTPAVALSQSLGEIARQARAERAKQNQQVVKVYTNDNLPQVADAESVTSSPSKQNATSLSANPQPAAPKSSISNAPEKEKRAKSDARQATSATNPSPADRLQSQIKAARAALAHATEEQRLVEDELSLLQMQQARDLNPGHSKELRDQVKAKETETAAKRAETEKARQALDQLEEEYTKASSAGSHQKQ